MLDRIFRIGMWWRVFYGFLRIVIGLTLIGKVGTSFSTVFYKLVRHELIEDPNDIFINFLSKILQNHPFSISYFLAIYLMFWGIVDIILSLNLLRHRPWAFPVSIFLITIFVCYELYRFFHTYSPILLGIILIDMIIIFLIKSEQRSTSALV